MTGALAGGLARRSIGRLDDTCWAGEVCLAKMGLEDLQWVKPGPSGASATRPLRGRKQNSERRSAKSHSIFGLRERHHADGTTLASKRSAAPGRALPAVCRAVGQSVLA